MGTTQSSTGVVNGWGYPASYLIDGISLDGIFKPQYAGGCATTNAGSIEWFSLELTQPLYRGVSRVQIATRTDCCADRIRNIRITIGASKEYDPNEPLCLPEIDELSQQAGLQDYYCTGELHAGKFVKISRPGQFDLCEVKVFTLQGKAVSTFHTIFLYQSKSTYEHTSEYRALVSLPVESCGLTLYRQRGD